MSHENQHWMVGAQYQDIIMQCYNDILGLAISESCDMIGQVMMRWQPEKQSVGC